MKSKFTEDNLEEEKLLADLCEIIPCEIIPIEMGYFTKPFTMASFWWALEEWMGDDLSRIRRTPLWELITTDAGREAGKYLGIGWEYGLKKGKSFNDMNRRIALLQAAVALAKMRGSHEE